MRLRFGRRRRGGGGGWAGNDPPARAVVGEPAVAPRPADWNKPTYAPTKKAPQPKPKVPPKPADPMPDPRGALAPESLDRALQRLRAEIPAQDEDASR
jgi:hypothetical protein